jgi:hypothetical protein
MAGHGVEVHLDHEIEALETDAGGNVSAVRTSQGRYPSDCVVIAIGVMPNTGWLAGSAIAVDERDGIEVDEELQTSAPDVFAAGDCASVRWFDGARRPEQLWYTARDQGRVAGLRLLGDTPRYDRGTWYNSAKLMDIEYTTAGLVNWNLEREQNWYFEEQGRVRSTTRVVVQDDRVVGFNMLGRRWDHTVLIRWIEERRSLDWVLGHLNEAAFDTELVPPLRVTRAERGPTGTKRAALDLPRRLAQPKRDRHLGLRVADPLLCRPLLGTQSAAALRHRAAHGDFRGRRFAQSLVPLRVPLLHRDHWWRCLLLTAPRQ